MRPSRAPEGAAGARSKGRAGRASRAPARGHARGRGSPRACSQGPSPPSRSQTASPLPQQAAAPFKLPSALQQLLATATSGTSLEARLEALRLLPGKLDDSASAAEMGAPGVLMSAWSKMLSLLADSVASVRQAAAPVLGCIGAMASKQPSRAGVSPGLLFDWAIPLMTAFVTDAAQPDEGSVYWALSALQHGLPGCDDKAVTRYGNALLDACQRLLEADTLPEHLLPLLLPVISQATRAEHSFRAHFQDLVELMVGWSFEPKLTDMQRQSIFDTLASFGAAWSEKQAFAAQLLSSLLADADKTASRASSEPLSAEEQYSLLAYVGCSAAICEACSLKCSSDPAGVSVESWGKAGPSSSSAPIVQQLCASLLRLYTCVVSSLSTTCAAAPQAERAGAQPARTSLSDQQHHESATPVTPPARHPERSESAQQQPEEAAVEPLQQEGPLSATQSAHMAMLGLALQACQADPAEQLMPILILYLQACQILQKRGHPIPLKALDSFLGSSILVDLDMRGGAAVQGVITEIAEVMCGTAEGRQFALQNILSQMTRFLKDRADGSAKQLPRYQVKVVGDLLQKEHSPDVSLAVWDALHEAVHPHKLASQCQGDFRTILDLLAKSSAKMVGQDVRDGSRGAQMRAFWLALAMEASAPEVSISAAQWLVRAALQCHAAAAQAADEALSRKSNDSSLADQLANLHLTAHGEGVQVTISARENTGEGVTGHGPAIAAASAFAAAAVTAVAAMSRAPDLTQRMTASQCALLLLQADKAPVPQRSMQHVQAAAEAEDSHLPHREPLSDSLSASAAAVLEDAALVQLGHIAVKGLGDVSGEVAASWRRVLDAIAPLITCLAGNASRTSLAAFLLLHKVQPPTRALQMQNSQGEHLEPPQLSRLLDWLTQASPAILIRPQASATTTEPGPNGKDAEMGEWICEIALASTSGGRPFAYSADATKWAVEVAARQVIQQRLRTHYGGAVQTLAAVEKGLHSRLSKCNQACERQQPIPGLLGGSTLLNFALGLEMQIQSACFGTLAMPSAATDAETQSFFAAPRNQMACTEWFVRLRPSLLKLSAALAHHSATAYHGLKHLELVPRRIEAVLAPAPGPGPGLSQQPGDARGAAAPSVAGLKQQKPAKSQQRQAVPVNKAPEAPRILRRSTVSDEGGSATGSGQLNKLPLQPSHPGQQSQGMQIASSPKSGDRAATRPLSAKEGLLQEILDTLWMVCSAFAELAQPDNIAGLHGIARTALSKLSRATLRDSCSTWMAGMEAEANGHLEAAVERYTASLQGLDSAGDLPIDIQRRLKGRLRHLYVSMGDYDALAGVGETGAATDFLRCLDSGRLNAAQQAAASMSQWDLQAESHSSICSIDSVLFQTLAHIVRCRSSSSQQSSAAEHVADRPGSAGGRSGRRAAWHPKQRGSRWLPNRSERGLAAEPTAQGLPEAQGTLEALQAERKRLHAAAALFGSEGLPGVVPIIADLCVLHEYEHVMQYSSPTIRSSAPPSSPATSMTFLGTGIQTSGTSLGTILVDCRVSWQAKREGAGNVGAKIADVRPSLRLERLYRLAGLSEQLPTYQRLLLATADTALCSGSFQLAEKLLGRASQLQPSHEADLECRKGSLQAKLYALTGHAGLESSATQLFSCLQSGSPGAAARAETLLLLSQLSTPTQPLHTDRQEPEAAGTASVRAGAQSAVSSSVIPGTEELLQRATSAAPQHSAVAAHAWRLYGDWLYSQHDMAGMHTTGSDTGASAARSRSAEAYCQAIRQSAGSASAGDTMSALLRVLQVAAYEGSSSLPPKSTLRMAIHDVPPLAWQLLTPQLFSLLARDKGAARQLAADVLASLGSHAPSATLFPALARMGREEAMASSEEMHQVLRPVKARHGSLLQQAQLLVQYLTEVACLWSEQWMHILRDAQAETGKHSRALNQELIHLKRLSLGEQEITQRLDHRWQAAMGPVLDALDSMSKATIEQPPSTAYQKAFHAGLAPRIQKATAALWKAASKGFSSAPEAQGILEQITTAVEQHCRPVDLTMEDICPSMAQMEDTAIPMMTSATSAAHLSDALTTIASIHSRLKVLGTKTRPKRFWITGSDGCCQSFLLKGREDLQLDERLMQMLHSTNAGLRADEASAYRGLRARTFAVIPLGPTTGVIEWVDHSAPLFGIYQAWQRRSALTSGPKGLPENPTPAEAEGLADTRQKLPSPTEAFYSRLLPPLKEAGISGTATRDMWPLEVLKKVMESLGAEVPAQLLARELFCGAASAADWLQRQRAFAGSAAVMSMIGWLLGLGDRHLDNILLDSSTGEVVHIDFNVVFDQGLRLRVPEIVPFRLTQMLKTALGITGTEGAFRAAAEGTLHALRSSSTAQSELLRSHCQEAGLVWNASHHESTLSKRSGLHVTLRLLGMRAEEASQHLLPALDPAAQALPRTSRQLSAWLAALQEASAATERAQAAHAEAACLQATVVAAQRRYQEAGAVLEGSAAAEQRMRADLVQLRSGIEQALRECRSWSERHAHTAEQLRHGSAQELQLPTHFWLSSDCRAPLGLVTSLTGREADSVLGCVSWADQAPSPDILGRCAAVDEKAAALLAERDQALLTATAALLEYSAALQQTLAHDYTAGSQHAKWTTALAACLAAHAQSLQADGNMETIQVLFHDAWQPLQVDMAPPDVLIGHKALHISAQLAEQAQAAAQGHVTDLTGRLSEAEKEAGLARPALAVQLHDSGPDRSPAMLSAVLCNLRRELKNAAVGDDPLWTVYDIWKGACEFIQLTPSSQGEDELSAVAELTAEADRHAAAAALVEAVVAPDLAACAAAGLNYAHMQEARAIESLQGDIGLLSKGPVNSADDLPGAQILLVDRFRGLTNQATNSSLILKPLALLSRLYDEQSLDDHPDGGGAWSSVAKQVGMMDNLLRACFAPQAADAAGAPASSAEEAALQASRACEARMVRAHAAHSAKRLAASACEVLDQLLGSRANAQPGDQEQHIRSTDVRAEGLSNLEASPGLEAADEHLNRLGQASSQVGSFDAGDESWLEEEAQLQSSQDHSRDHNMYAGEDEPQLTGSSRPVSVVGGMSEQRELQPQQSLLDFDEGPEVAGAAALEPQAAQMDVQVDAAQESAHQQLPAYFGGADDDSMALVDLLEEGSGIPSDGFLDSLEPRDVHADSAAARRSEALPSFFQPDEGTGLLEGLELEPDASQHCDELAERVPEQEPAATLQAGSESGTEAATSASNGSNPKEVPELDQGSTEGPYFYGATAAAAGQEAASQVSTLSGMFRPLTPAAAQEHRHPQRSSQTIHSEQPPEDQSAIDNLQIAVHNVGKAAGLRAQLVALSAALKQADDSQQAKIRAISRYEWMYEAILGPAGVLGPPVKLTHLEGWQLQRRRAEVMEALDASIRHLLSLEAPLNAWTAHSGQAEAALISAADMAGGQVPARLRHFLQLRTQWLNISGEHVASVARVGQAVMHLELSREGRAWVSPSGISSGCEGHAPLLERMQRTCIARLAAATEAERCTAEMRTLTSELESAQPSLRSAAEAEDATAAACARCTPALIQESAALKQHLAQSLGAADCLKAGLPHLHMVAADLKLMLAQDTMPTDAFEALARIILASNSCLKRELPVILTQLQPLLASLPGSETAAHVRLQPKGQPAVPTADAMRRAADLVAAAASHMPTFEAQVTLTQQAGEAAASLVTKIPALLAECHAVLAMLRGQPASASQAGSSTQTTVEMQACAEAWERRMHAREQAHAELVHSRFMHKLTGTHHLAKGKEEPVAVSAPSTAADRACSGTPGSQDGTRQALSVEGQVAALIREATSLDNLAQMYEGWSAWI